MFLLFVFDDCRRDFVSWDAELAIFGGRVWGIHVLLAIKRLSKQA